MMADLTSYTGPCEAVADMAAAQGPDILNDGKNVVSPFMAGEKGRRGAEDIVSARP